MAEIQQQATGPPTGGKRRAKRLSTRVGMTPMVDLAFLLLTFFMLTTTFAKPSTMELTMPVKSKEPPELNMKRAMTILLGKGHQVHYYFGLHAPQDPTVPRPQLHTTTFGATGIRQALRAAQQQRPGLVVLIKPSPDSKYQDMVDILDEMNIGKQPKYALVDINPDDLTLLHSSAL